MANQLTPVIFVNCQPGWEFSVNVDIHTGTGFGDVTLSDPNPVTPDVHQHGTNFVSSVTIGSPGCVGFTRVTASQDLTCDIVYKVTDANGLVRFSTVHTFDQASPLPANSVYSAVSFAST